MSDTNKELKGSNAATALVIALIVGYFYFMSPPSWVSKATDKLTIEYIDRGIYKPVDCRAKKNKQGWFVLCSAVGGKIGGLFYIEESGRTYPVNGKAKQHLPALAVAAAPAQIDITAALSLF